MKYPPRQPEGQVTTADHGLADVESACRESLDDLRNGHVEPLNSFIGTLETRLQEMRSLRAGK